MNDGWMEILKTMTAARGQSAVAKEMGVSATTLSLVLAEKYPAATDNIERRVMEIYGDNGVVNCPMLGEIEPSRCAETWQRAQKIKSPGNPATIRLYAACRKCLKRR